MSGPGFERDKIDPAFDVREKANDTARIDVTVVDILEQDILKRQPAPRRVGDIVCKL